MLIVIVSQKCVILIADGPLSSTSSADAEKYSWDSLRTESYEQNGVDEGRKPELAKGSAKERDVFQEDSSDLQREHEAIPTSASAAKETTKKTTTFPPKLEDQRSDTSSLSRSPISNVRTMIGVFESNPSEVFVVLCLICWTCIHENICY